jgi:hypothetical protein
MEMAGFAGGHPRTAYRYLDRRAEHPWLRAAYDLGQDFAGEGCPAW